MKLNGKSGYVLSGDDVTEKDVDKYIDENICVYISQRGQHRQNFGLAISINGILEKHSDNNSPKYRVLVNNDTYAYFTLNDVHVITHSADKDRPNFALIMETQIWGVDIGNESGFVYGEVRTGKGGSE